MIPANALLDMQVLRSIAEAGSLSAAGRALDMAPSTVSKRVAHLESRLGVRLMHRSTRRLRLTEEGQVYLELARRVLGEVQEVEASLSNRGAAPRGVLRVSAPAAFGRKHVAPAIPAFLSRYPGVSVQLHLSEALVDLVEEGFDLAVRIGEPKEESFVARKLAANRRVVCASPAFLRAHGVPRRPSDLARMNCLILGERNAGQGVWTFEGPEGTQRVRVGGTLQCNDSEVIYQWAIAGLGLALKSLWDVGASIRQGRLQAVLPDYRVPGADIHALYPQRKLVSPKVRAFVQFLAERFGPVPYWETAPARGRRAASRRG